MNLEKLQSYQKQYTHSLLDDVIPFWDKFSIDQKRGGYFTCLDNDGKIYDSDKFVWLQARQVWTYAMLHNRLDSSPQWLQTAKIGAEFLDAYAFDSSGNCFFSLDRNGNPLVQPYNIFSDCFLVMAFAQYGIASGEDYYIQKAKQSFQRILSRQENPKGKYNKTISKNRPLKNFALPMILSNLVMELKSVLPKEEVSKVIDQCVSEIVSDFLSLDEGIIFENVLPGGKRSDSFEGRLINPGHGIEACWFLMDIGYDQGDSALIHQMKEVSLSLVKYGWDHQFGGIFYFLDAKGHPPQQLEWDQKLWWVHLEALVAMAKGYQYTGDESCMEWFEKLHEYTWSHFRDDRGGLEWYGYLNRRGEVLLPIKGGKWKGCFHVPRALFSVASTFQNMVTRSETISKA